MMNDGNPLKARLKHEWFRFTKKRYLKFLHHEIDGYIQRNPDLLKVKLTPDELAQVQEKWKGLRMPVSPIWHQIYKNVLGEFDPNMMPNTVFRLRVEPYVTDHQLTKAYCDKNAHHIFIPDANRPEMILQHVHNRYYGKQLTPLSKSEVERYLKAQEGAFFLKPAMDGNGGRFITPFKIDKGTILVDQQARSVEDLLAPYPQNFLIQRKVIQHKLAADIYPHAVNTFRITSIREGHDIRIQSNVMRLGRGGCQIDNTSQGGMVVGIEKDGRVSPRGLDKNFKWLEAHPETGAVFADLPAFPYVKKMEAEAIRLHERFPYADIICWDLTYDENDQVVVIEYNNRGFGLLYQQALQGPYFGDKTDEWIEKLREVWKHAGSQKGYYPSLPKY